MSGILLAFASALLTSAGLLFVLARVLPSDFLLAGTSSRSNHAQPARQIGGLAAAPAAIAILVAASFYVDAADASFLLAAAAGAALLAAVGYVDDRLELPVMPRLACQIAAVVLLLASLGADFRILPDAVPIVLERAATAILLMWFVNLTNFMDGVDLMVVAGIGVPHALLTLFGFLTGTGGGAVISAAVAGAVFGFAPYNTPPARIFLGDSGSLAIGFLTGAVVLLIARDHPVAAFLPFLYFIADSTSVLLLRLAKGENVLEAHSFHAYQLARRAGQSSVSIAMSVAILSMLCTLSAIAAILSQSAAIVALSLAASSAASAALIARMRGVC
jgi:UDP-N-acetylmuramyl pentapeptide phosphotransferase/UDP-N-acetylglucosamine-1-phosphate transferase